MSDGGYCPRCKTATYGAHACPKPSAPTSKYGGAVLTCPICKSIHTCDCHAQPAKDAGAREWMLIYSRDYGAHVTAGGTGTDSNIKVIEYAAYERQTKAFEYLVSMLPEECTAGFVTEARKIAKGT